MTTINAKLNAENGLVFKSKMNQFDSFTATVSNGRLIKIHVLKTDAGKTFEHETISLTTEVECSIKKTENGNFVGVIAGGEIHFAIINPESPERFLKGESKKLFDRVSSKVSFGTISLADLIAVMTQRKQNKAFVTAKVAEINSGKGTSTIGEVAQQLSTGKQVKVSSLRVPRNKAA